MALSRILNEKNDCPYYRPPNLHIRVLKMQEEEKVLAWHFGEMTATPVTIKKNRVAAITDGQSVCKITLFEEFGGKVDEGSSYVMRGYGLLGQRPPYYLSIMRSTKFYRGSDIAVPPHLFTEAENLINPPSMCVGLREAGEQKGLFTIKGKVTEISSLLKVRTGREQVPVKNIKVEEDGFQMRVSLWREASASNVNVGEMVTVSHVKVESSAYGRQLKSTKFTKVEKQQRVDSRVAIVGVMDCPSDDDSLELLTVDGENLFISKVDWEPFEPLLSKGQVLAEVVAEGKQIKEIKACNPS